MELWLGLLRIEIELELLDRWKGCVTCGGGSCVEVDGANGAGETSLEEGRRSLQSPMEVAEDSVVKNRGSWREKRLHLRRCFYSSTKRMNAIHFFYILRNVK